MANACMKIFNKLVRDRIPEIIGLEGRETVTRTLNDQEYEEQLFLKLLEEVEELRSARTIDELADVIEVIRAMADHFGYALQDAEREALIKRERCGGFERRIFLVSSDD